MDFSFVHVAFFIFLIVLVAASEISDECSKSSVSDAIDSGDLTLARYLANDALNQNPTCQSQIARHYVLVADQFLQSSRGMTRYPSKVTITNKLEATIDGGDCWSWINESNKIIPTDLWHHCCSLIKTFDEPTTLNFQSDFDGDNCSRGLSRLCCDFFHGSSSYLHLPLLKELAIRIRVRTDEEDDQGNAMEERYDLQQDGFLRHFDTSGVLWPTAYLLSLCLAAPNRCGIPELYQAVDKASNAFPFAVELGAGIGAPSISLARTLQRRQKMKKPTSQNKKLVVATDKAPHALDLIRTNAYVSEAEIATELLDHFNVTSLERFQEHFAPPGFAIVLGSSLQELFNETTSNNDHHLWTILDTLMDSSNPNAVAILAHSINTIVPPVRGNDRFQLVRRISGDKFGMSTRFNESSDFFISVFSRSESSKSQLYSAEL